MDMATARDRFRGAILGTAVGDAIGAPFEGRPGVDEASLAAWRRDDAPLRFTDDTAMTIGVAESLVARGTFDGADMAQRFVAHHDAEPWRGYGGGPPQVFDAIRGGEPWYAPAAQLFGGQGSFGNGAAMRVAPVGLFFCRDLVAVAGVARGTAAITHAHELALQGAAVQAHAVGWFAISDPKRVPSMAGSLLDDLRRVAWAGPYQRALGTVATLEADRDEDAQRARERAVAGLGNGIAAVEAVPAALHAMLRNLWSFEDAVTYAVRLGGDTDTIAAMTGALAGAFLGYSTIPDPWVQRLEAHDDLVALADDLFDTSDASGDRRR